MVITSEQKVQLKEYTDVVSQIERVKFQLKELTKQKSVLEDDVKSMLRTVTDNAVLTNVGVIALKKAKSKVAPRKADIAKQLEDVYGVEEALRISGILYARVEFDVEEVKISKVRKHKASNDPHLSEERVEDSTLAE
ncbi:hypothetical protein HDU93_005313 [Gonapodya sp. JEL0774]|nr:hypothetical protein HDU93_005313 [Gonapodya sp. JEL0774]